MAAAAATASPAGSSWSASKPQRRQKHEGQAQPPRRRRRQALLRILKWSLVALVVLGVGAAVARYIVQARRDAAVVHYETVAVDRGPIAAKVTATGNVSALVTVLVGSQVSGRIDAIFVDFASEVRKGQTIATIEPSFFRAAVAQGRANHASAQAAVDRSRAHMALADKNFVRAKNLIAEGLMSRAEYDATEAALTAAKADEATALASVKQTKAALDQAELNLRYTKILSPIDGVVISRNIDVGQTVAAALQAPTLFTIAQDLTRMQVDTNVAEADIGKIQSGMKVTFTVDAHPGRVFEGIVRQVRDNATTIQNVVTYDAVIDVDNAERVLKPGMTASVTFTYAMREDVIRLPNSALRFKPDAATRTAMKSNSNDASSKLRNDQRTVWILDKSNVAAPSAEPSARPLVVTIGISDGSSTEIVSGDVRAGDRAIIEATAATTTPTKSTAATPASSKRGP